MEELRDGMLGSLSEMVFDWVKTMSRFLAGYMNR